MARIPLSSPIFRVVNVRENILWEYMSSRICVFYHSIKNENTPYSSNKAYYEYLCKKKKEREREWQFFKIR